MPNQVLISCSTASPSSGSLFNSDYAGVYLIREHKDQLKPHDISLPVIAKDAGEHKCDTGGKLGKFPMILNENGQERPIFESNNALEFFKAYSEAFLAHQRLWEEAHILHRNICPNVILVNERGHGFLVDWDHSPEFHNFARKIMSEIKYIKRNDKFAVVGSIDSWFGLLSLDFLDLHV